MKITRRQLRQIITDAHNRHGSMRDFLPDDIMHEMRVIQIMNTLVAMKRNGHTNEELVRAISEVQEKIRQGDMSAGGIGDASDLR